MKTVYWDSCVFHALFSEEKERVEICRKIIEAAQKGELQIYTSAITAVEVVWIKNFDRMSSKHEETIQKFFEHKFIRVLTCDRGIAAEARRLLWQHAKLKPKDAIHVASAISQGVDVMHTYDDGDLVKPLSGKIGNPPMRICHPEYTNPPSAQPSPPELPLKSEPLPILPAEASHRRNKDFKLGHYRTRLNIDQQRAKAQYVPFVKSPGIVVILFFLMILSAAAQSNPSLVATNTVVGGRRMSLQDCIQEALQHNLDVQIQRYNPEISLYNLSAAYGPYDPTFSLSGTHSYNVQPGGFFEGIQLPSETIKNDSFNSGLTGELPWTGLQYNFSGNISQQHFDTPTTNGAFSSRNSSGSAGVQLTQPLLKNFWIDSTRLTIRVDKNRLHYSEQGFREQVITSVTAVENAYYELIYALENLKVQQEALTLSQTQLDQDQQRLQIGTVAQLSVQQDESQVAQNQANVISAQSTLETDQNTLKSLITDDYSQWHAMDLQPTEPLAAPLELFDLQDSWSRGMTERPDLLQARLNVEQAGIQLKFYRNQLFPQLDLTGTYGWNGVGSAPFGTYDETFGEVRRGDAPYYSYGAQLSMPLSNQSARNQFKSGKATLQQVVLQLKQFEQNVMVEIDNAVKTAQSDYESVDATRQARVYAEEALDAEQKTYAVGKATTFEVLTYQNNLTAARGQEIRALANYEEALDNLASQEGSTLEKLGINIRAK
jgi:outer membrane protein TolC/predicted nucleic acid-binding protein